MAQGFPDFSKAIILMGQDKSGKFVPVKVDINGNLEIVEGPPAVLDGGDATTTAGGIDGGTA